MGQPLFSETVAQQICARAAAGESLRAIGRDPAMPAFRTISNWSKTRAGFRQALLAARVAGGGPLTGRRSSYCIETAQAIFERLCAGEGMISICRDATMPAYSTAWKWMRDVAEFAEAVAMARDIQAEMLFEKGSEVCEAVTSATAVAARVQLTHLRWQAGKLAPKKFGPHRPMEAPADPMLESGGGLTVVLKRFVLDGTPGGRESDEPEELLYRLTPAQIAGKIEGRHPATAAWEARAPERAAAAAAFAEAKQARLAAEGITAPPAGPEDWR
jgi:hypothetical protein